MVLYVTQIKHVPSVLEKKCTGRKIMCSNSETLKLKFCMSHLCGSLNSVNVGANFILCYVDTLSFNDLIIRWR